MLLMRPNITASTLCKETGIPDSKIYYALDGLTRKGMLIVQQGNPNIYRPIPPKEAIANLKQQLTEQLNEKIKEADVLADQLAPIYDSAEKPEELELAYIIRGQRNMLNRMKALIETARKEITIFIPSPSVLEEIKDLLTEAKERRRVKLRIAATQEILEKEDLSSLGEIRLLCCPLEMLVVDMKNLMTMSSLTDDTAMLTQDPGLIRVFNDCFNSPTCCTKIEQKH